MRRLNRTKLYVDRVIPSNNWKININNTNHQKQMVHWGNTVARRESESLPPSQFSSIVLSSILRIRRDFSHRTKWKRQRSFIIENSRPPARASASVLRKFHTGGAVRKERNRCLGRIVRKWNVEERLLSYLGTLSSHFQSWLLSVP